jgi:TonB-linked SusC/RagA family outer membrane protein
VEVSYDGSIAMQNIAKEYDTPSAYEYALGYNSVYDEYQRLRPDDPIFTNAVVKKFTSDEIANYKENGGTDWFNLLTRKGEINKHQISLSSGTEKSKIYASLGYMDHQGVIKLSDMQRLSTRLNLSQKFGEIFEAAIRLNASTTKNTNIPVGSSDVGFSRGGATSGVFSFNPTIAPYDENGEVAKHPFNQQHNNPAGLLLTDFNSESNRLITNGYLKADIAPGLFAKLSAGYDKVMNNSRTWVPAEAKNNLASSGEATVGSFTNETQTLNFIVQYNKNFKKHNLGIMAGTDYQAFEYNSLLAKSTGFKTSAYKYNSMQSGDVQKTITSKSSSTIFSYLSRLNYSFDEKYLLTATLRYDGSSKFAEGKKWGFFPSIAFAWKLYNEPFIADLNLFSNLKLRTSYGKTGNQAIGNNNSQPLLGSRMEYVIGNTRGVPIGPVSPGNNDLSWETTKQTNFGLDFGFVDNRILGSIDLYRMDTEDLLLWFGTPSTSGFGGILKNAGSIRNQGIEFAITTQNTTGIVDWSTSFNIANNQDRWLDRAGLPFAPEEEFGPVRGIYGYEVVGMFKEGDDIANSAQPNSIPGQWIYNDVAGRDADGNWVETPDEKINADDRVLLGSNTPKVTAGFTNNVTYKGLTLTLFFQGMFGYDIWNNAKIMHENPFHALQLEGLNKNAFNFYTPNNQNTNVPTPVANPYGGSNNKYLEDGDFVRLKTINLNYQLPIQNSWIKAANVYVNIDNAILWTKYEGLDPETARAIGTKSGSENDVYPNSRTYSLGLRMTF